MQNNNSRGCNNLLDKWDKSEKWRDQMARDNNWTREDVVAAMTLGESAGKDPDEHAMNKAGGW